MYILVKIKREMLEITYDESTYADVKRIYNKIHDVVFISRLRKKIKEYISAYLTY